ncbi:hypothetical protein Leryth_013730 [Lithospermum erythrorhizon]|nr:hypothetical protein Leryth_013730 [Lithospermum erythrorhizon]
MTTKYGTIPALLEDSNLDVVVSNAKQKMRSDLGSRRPWKELISFSLPDSLRGAFQRIQTNMSYFHMNYVIIVLFLIFMSLLWHPVSLIVFMIMMLVWLFLYFLRDDPIIVLGYLVHDSLILVVLSIVTVVVLLLTRTSVVLLGLLAGIILVALHGAFRQTDDLMLDADGGDGWGRKLNLKETASSTYSSLA